MEASSENDAVMVRRHACGSPATARTADAQRPAIADTGTVELCRSCAAFTIRPMPRSSVNLTRHFLIAMPAMVDPNFAHTLTYVCEHNPDGALGIVVNRPTDMTLQTLFEQIDIPLGDSGPKEARVHFGGPVQVDRGFVLHRPLGNWQSTLAISDDLGLTTSKDVLEAVGRGDGPADVLVSLGYAGWSAGQLEQELAQNAWLTVEADPDLMFEMPAEARLPAAMRLLGIDFSRLSGAVGHA
jgi:putative transcriptional regulator